MKKIEPYDLMHEHVSKKNHQTNETLILNCCQQAHEWLPYEEFSIDMKKSNNEQKFTIYDIIYKKLKHPSMPLHLL
jgi:4-hydroxy-3-methylbut-2-en-1-yl diphosphate synthase IspG/GcpE